MPKHNFVFAVTLFGIAAAMAACSSPGPVAPVLADSPQTAVTITNDLQGVLKVPNVAGAQLYTRTPDGLLRYQFQLQNNSDQSFWIQTQATFYDGQGVAVDNQTPKRFSFTPGKIETISAQCANDKAQRVRVQVSPDR